MQRRDFVALSGSGLFVLSGCISGAETEPAKTSDDTHTDTDSPNTASENEPEYTTCTPEEVSVSAPESAQDIPDSLTHDSIVTYVESVERDIVLPADTDGYLQIGETTTESVTNGFLAEVPITGGYYNEATDGDSTETVHYDLPPHTSRYFLTRNLVRRVKTQGNTADPRQEGDLLVCTMD